MAAARRLSICYAVIDYLRREGSSPTGRLPGGDFFVFSSGVFTYREIMTITQHTINTPYMVGPVHCYTTERDGELILFDTGPSTDNARQYLLETIDLERLRYVFMTHCHIDHYGLAWWLEENSDATLFIPYRDSLKMMEHERRLKDIRVLLETLGFAGKYLDAVFSTFQSDRIFPPFPKQFKIVEDDMPGHLGLDVLSCPGHSQSDLVYVSDNWAVTGDVLLRGVFQSPLLDIDLETGERFGNYEAYCATISKLATLRQKTVCPGHRTRIDSVDDSLLFYVSKMLGRVAQLDKHDAVNGNIAEVIKHHFGESLKEPFHLYLKASEIVFMQDFLVRPELLQKALEETGLFAGVEDKFSRAVEHAPMRKTSGKTP